MRVELSKEEVEAACAEWVERHHGLKVKGRAITRFSYPPKLEGSVIARFFSVEFPDVEVRVPGTPYRGD